MPNLVGLAEFVSKLRAARTSLADELRQVDAALVVLGKMKGGSSYTKPGRTLSALGRRRISLAQKARWAKHTSSNGEASVASPKRVMSAAARRKIAAAQRARWAKVKASKKS